MDSVLKMNTDMPTGFLHIQCTRKYNLHISPMSPQWGMGGVLKKLTEGCVLRAWVWQGKDLQGELLQRTTEWVVEHFESGWAEKKSRKKTETSTKNIYIYIIDGPYLIILSDAICSACMPSWSEGVPTIAHPQYQPLHTLTPCTNHCTPLTHVPTIAPLTPCTIAHPHSVCNGWYMSEGVQWYTAWGVQWLVHE